MKKALKKEIFQYGVIALVALLLYITGLHTQLIGHIQRVVLATGLIRPNTEQTLENRAVLDLDLQLQDANGKTVHMEQFRGKVIFINVWATWCPPCLAEMPNINQLYQDLTGEDIVFVLLSVDQDFSKATTYIAAQDFQFPIYQVLGNWPTALNSSSIPTTFVIDKSGRIAMEHRGMAKYNTKDFKAFLRSLL